jgi:hypothetical protein
MTIPELESACNESRPLDFSRHHLQGPATLLKKTFYPHGFPVEVRTNAPEIIAAFCDMWSLFRRVFDTSPIQIEVQVVDVPASQPDRPPPATTFRMMLPTLFCIADADNYSIVHLEQNRAQIVVARSTLPHKLYLRHHLLETAVGALLATHHVTPIHAACVALNGCGVMLCGDSGAGKSSLAYACARAGWTYIADDCSLLLHGGRSRTVTGDCHHIRLRPSAAALFPEINRLKMTPRAAGKPTIQIATAARNDIATARTARVDFMVFLNRTPDKPQTLLPYRRDVARQFMRQVVYGSPNSLAAQYESIERLLAVDVLELRYTGIDWAVARLKTLAQEGV